MLGQNWAGEIVCTAALTLEDAYGNRLSGKDIWFSYGDNSATTYTTDSNGQVTVPFTPSSMDLTSNSLIVRAQFKRQLWDGQNAYAAKTKSFIMRVVSSVTYDTSLSLAHSYTGGDTINLSDLSTASIPVTATLVTDDTDLSSQYALEGRTVVFRCSDGLNTTTLGTATTNSNGVATANLTGLPSTTSSSIDIIASFTDSNNQYGDSSSSISFNINDGTTPTAVDPLSDSLLFDITNWGTYPAGSSGSGLTGTPSAATTSDMTISLQDKTITTSNGKYFVYNYTLQDFLDYYNNYNDEFSLIIRMNSGDGRYDFGFLNTTTGGYRIGYMSSAGSINVMNEENNISITTQEYGDGQTKFQKYNQLTFKKVGTDLHLYYKIQGVTWVDRTLALGSVDLSKYHLFVKTRNSYGNMTITNDATKIDNPSRQQ